MSCSKFFVLAVCLVLSLSSGYVMRACNGNGVLVERTCKCFESYSGANCENYLAFACVNGHCDAPGTYCSYGAVDCSDDSKHCGGRTGWCLPVVE